MAEGRSTQVGTEDRFHPPRSGGKREACCATGLQLPKDVLLIQGVSLAPAGESSVCAVPQAFSLGCDVNRSTPVNVLPDLARRHKATHCASHFIYIHTSTIRLLLFRRKDLLQYSADCGQSLLQHTSPACIATQEGLNKCKQTQLTLHAVRDD